MTSAASKVDAINFDDPDWYLECSDEEVYRETGLSKGQLGPDKWRPKPEEAVKLFNRIAADENKLLNLRYVPPGRRPPTPDPNEYETDDSEEEVAANPAASAGEDKNDGFDFDADEDDPATPVTTPRRPLGGSRELKGSARKKTTSFNSVLSNMKRHRQMDAANRAAAAANKTPNPPK